MVGGMMPGRMLATGLIWLRGRRRPDPLGGGLIKYLFSGRKGDRQ